MSFESLTVETEADQTHIGSLLLARRENQGLSSRTRTCRLSEDLELEDPLRFKAFSVSLLWAWENDSTGLRIARSNNRTLRTLAYILGWNSHDFYETIGFAIGPVPRIDHEKQAHVFPFVERYGFKYNASIRLPVYGSVAAGVEGFDSVNDPDEYKAFDPRELPADANPKDLYLVYANGNSMYQEDMSRAIPNGSKLVVHHGAAPANNQVVVAYIPEREIGVVKEFVKGRDMESVRLRSFRQGGPCFLASDYPSMYVSGVVRRIIIDL